MRRAHIALMIAAALAASFLVWTVAFAIATWVRFAQPQLAKMLFFEGNVLAPAYYAAYYLANNGVRVNALIAAGAALLVVAIAAVDIRRRLDRDPWQARWATMSDLLRHDFLSLRRGLVLGRLSPGLLLPVGWDRRRRRIAFARFGGSVIRALDTRHMAVFGATRSGKGVGVVVPAIVEAPGSVFAVDQKGENLAITAGARAEKGRVFVFNPYSAATHRFNPLDLVRREPGAFETDISRLAEYLIPLPKDGKTELFWAQAAQDLFKGLVAYVLESAEHDGDRTLFSVLGLLRNGNTRDWISDVLEEPGPEISPFTQRALRAFLNLDSDKVRSSVQKQVDIELSFLDNPLVRNATATSDFDLSRMSHETMSIFVCMTSEEMGMASGLVRLMVQQASSFIQRRNPLSERIGPVRFVLDEFGRLGRLESLVNDFPYLAGYNAQFIIAAQTLTQLHNLYGRERAAIILGNTSYQLVLGVNDNDTGTYYSDRLGMRTASTQSRSSSFRGIVFQPQMSRSQNVVGVALAANADLQRLDQRRGVLIIEGVAPVLTYRLRYFEEWTLRRLASKPMPVELLNLRARKLRLKEERPASAAVRQASVQQREMPAALPPEKPTEIETEVARPAKLFAPSAKEKALIAALFAEKDRGNTSPAAVGAAIGDLLEDAGLDGQAVVAEELSVLATKARQLGDIRSRLEKAQDVQEDEPTML